MYLINFKNDIKTNIDYTDINDAINIIIKSSYTDSELYEEVNIYNKAFLIIDYSRDDDIDLFTLKNIAKSFITLFEKITKCIIEPVSGKIIITKNNNSKKYNIIFNFGCNIQLLSYLTTIYKHGYTWGNIIDDSIINYGNILKCVSELHNDIFHSDFDELIFNKNIIEKTLITAIDNIYVYTSHKINYSNINAIIPLNSNWNNKDHTLNFYKEIRLNNNNDDYCDIYEKFGEYIYNDNHYTDIISYISDNKKYLDDNVETVINKYNILNYGLPYEYSKILSYTTKNTSRSVNFYKIMGSGKVITETNLIYTNSNILNKYSNDMIYNPESEYNKLKADNNDYNYLDIVHYLPDDIFYSTNNLNTLKKYDINNMIYFTQDIGFLLSFVLKTNHSYMLNIIKEEYIKEGLNKMIFTNFNPIIKSQVDEILKYKNYNIDYKYSKCDFERNLDTVLYVNNILCSISKILTKITPNKKNIIKTDLYDLNDIELYKVYIYCNPELMITLFDNTEDGIKMSKRSKINFMNFITETKY